MPNHDMSDTACRERAAMAAQIDELDSCVKELFLRLDTLMLIVLADKPEVVAQMPDAVKALYDRMRGDNNA